MAGWAGLLVTGLNMMPMGQLDGGHVAFGIFGRRAIFVSYAALLGLHLFHFLLQAVWLCAHAIPGDLDWSASSTQQR